jgi:NAD(P)H-nitrite reductase large subunit
MYVASGQLSEHCIEPYERDHYTRMKFDRVRDRVTHLDSANKRLTLESGGHLFYDRLLIASGSVPIMIPWPGIDLEGVGNFVSRQDLEWFRKQMKTTKRAVVIGGGLIGIESVEVLLQSGIKTTFLIREDYYWPIALDKTEGDLISEHMRHHQCDVRLKTEMKEVIGNEGRVVGIRTTEGETIDCEMLVLTIGVRPQTDWLKESDLDLDERGGIVVGKHLETNLPDIWAAGDCTSVVWFNGVRRPEQLWYTSRDQGLIAGHNLAGDERIYKRGTFYNSAKFFDIEYTTAGLVNFQIEGEQNWFQREPGTPNTVRITHLPDQTVIGFNMLGRRWQHETLVRWVEEKRRLDWVLKHLTDAIFDEEFMPKFRVLDKV